MSWSNPCQAEDTIAPSDVQLITFNIVAMIILYGCNVLVTLNQYTTTVCKRFSKFFVVKVTKHGTPHKLIKYCHHAEFDFL